MNRIPYKRNLLVPTLKMVADSLTVFAAIVFAYWLRFFSPLTAIFPVTKGIPPLSVYLYFALFIVIVYWLLFSIFGNYRSRFFPSYREDIPVILKVNILAMLVAMSSAFMYRGFSFSRLVFILIYLNSNLFLLIERYFFHLLKRRFLLRGYNRWKMAVMGSSETLPTVIEKLLPNNTYFELTGYISSRPIDTLPLDWWGDLKEFDPAQLPASVDGFIIAFHHREHPFLMEILQKLEGHNYEIFYVPDILDIFTTNVRSTEINGVPLLQLKSFNLSGWQGLLKRTFDITVATTALILLSPLMALIALLVKLSSEGPVFYKQQRITLGNREFTMLKFRTMYVDAEARTGPVWTQKGDPRVTPIGRILRRLSLDELPQLINVIKGDMSLVGPRPERRYFVEQFQKQIPHYAERHRVRCGMTGWAQVNGLRGQSPIEERTKYDLYYIQNWSLWFDIKIIILTVIAVIKGENAY